MTNLLFANRKVKSLGRAYRRGHLTILGNLISHRPFNNRANTSNRKGVQSRIENEIKKRDYEAAKRRTNK